ncbi:hypothetical protein Aperf_G00000091138 [Anoplocephala perfoliata]
MDVKGENLQNDEFSLTIPTLSGDFHVPDIGSTVVISENQSETSCDSPSKIWTGKRAVCSFSANSNDLDDYPFHAVTYGEPCELYGLPYNDHNYAKVCEDESNGDNQLALLAKVALSRKENSDISPQRPDSASKVVTTSEVISSSVYRNSTVPHVTIIKTPFLSQTYQNQKLSTLQSTVSGPTCKVATSNGRTILLTPNRGNLGASVQIHRVSSVKTSQVLLRTDLNSTKEGIAYNGISGTVSGSIRCICGYNRDDGCLVQCSTCKVFQHAECMAPSPNIALPKPYQCELCQPRPVMVSEAVCLQRRKLAFSNTPTTLTASTIRLTNSTTAFRLPRTNVPVHNPTIAPNRFFLTGSATGQNPTTASLSVRPIQVRLGEVVGSSSAGATLYQVDSTTLNQFSPRFINLDAAVARQHSQPSYISTTGSQRTSKRKQDLFTLAGESTSTFDNMSSNYSYDGPSASNDQHMSASGSNNHTSTVSCSENNDLPGPKFYRTPSQAMGSVLGVDVVEGTKSQLTGTLATGFGDITSDVSALSCGVPEPNSADVVIRSDSYEKAAETRLSEALKQRIRNIFLTPSERELKTLQMADSFALSRGQQRCRVANFELGRKGLIATESIYPNQPIIEYKGYAMLMDEYVQQHDYKRRYNPFVLFYKQLDKAVICLDASNYGNEARFLRRSCMPNCEVSPVSFLRLHYVMVRLTFPPTDSFSSVVNPQCIQFVITSSVNRVIPVGTELTVGFDFDYTACSYPVRCACGRGPSLCAVADWFRRHRHLSLSSATSHHHHQQQRHRDYSDTEEKYPRDGGDDDFEDEIADDSEADYLYDRSLLASSRNRHGQAFVEKPARSRIALKRLLNPKRVSPAFSRVPYPSAKHMVQEQQYRRHPNGIAGTFPTISKRGGRGTRRTRGSGRGRGVSGGSSNGLTRQHQQLRAGRPRGRPPSSSIKRNSTHRPPPQHLASPTSRLHSDIDFEEEDEDDFGKSRSLGAHPPASIASSSRTDVTEPTSTSPWHYSVRSPPTESSARVRRYSGVEGARRKGSLGKDPVRLRHPSKMQSPRRTRRRASMDVASSSGVVSPSLRSPEDDDAVFVERLALEDAKSPISSLPKVKRARKMSGRVSNGVDTSPRSSEKGGGVSAAKRPRRQSDFGAYDSHAAQEGQEDQTKEQSRSSKSREDKWLAEVMRRIERMEKKCKRNPTDKKPKVESKPELPSPRSPSIEDEVKEEVAVKGETAFKQEEDEALKDEQSGPAKKPTRRSTVSMPSGSHSTSTSLSREDRWMQMQIQRIAEMESADASSADQLQRSSSNSSTMKQRRRASSGAKSLGNRPSQKKEALDSSNFRGAEGEKECSLIVYKRRDQDPMAKFSRSRTAHHHHQQESHLIRSYSLVESFADEELPAGGELLDDHADSGMGANGVPNFSDASCSNAALSVGSSSPPKPSKKRWLSQALMEEDQQHQQNLTVRTSPSPEESLTPPDSSMNSTQNQRALNPKKRIISQLEEAMAQQRRSSSPSDQVSPSSDAHTPSSKLPPKKRQSEEEATMGGKESRPVTPKKPKPEKVRMSLSEYRRRRGLSTTSVESGAGTNKVRPVSQPAAAVPPLPPAPTTPPGSPVVDLKLLTLPPLPLLPPSASKLPLGGPRTPSEPPSDDDDQGQDAKTTSVLLDRTQPPLSAPASLPSPNRRYIAERFNAFSSDSPKNVRTSPPPHRPPSGGCDRHLSGHAQRRASPPPPPHLGSGSDSTTSPVSPNPPLVEHVLRRDREIIQWQMERKHNYHHSPINTAATTTPHTHRRSSQLTPSSAHRNYHDYERSASYSYHRARSSLAATSSPSTSKSCHQAPLLPPPPPPLAPTSPVSGDNIASAFNHHDVESIQETLRRKQERLRSQLNDLQKAAASGSG